MSTEKPEQQPIAPLPDLAKKERSQLIRSAVLDLDLGL